MSATGADYRVSVGPEEGGVEKGAVERYAGNVIGIGVQKLLDVAHFLSAGMVSFARGLNDTPKIVALLLVVQGLAIQQGMLIVAVAMAAGGLLSAGRVARTVSHRITPMNHGQGFTANLVTAGLVIISTRMGFPSVIRLSFDFPISGYEFIYIITCPPQIVFNLRHII